MVRELKMADVQTILRLHQAGKSNREIARLTGIHRETVAKYVSQAGSKPAKPDHRVRSGPANACEPFRDLIVSKLESGLEGVRIFQDLRDEHGFQASYSSVRRFIQGLEKAAPLPFRRIEVSPGEEAQIDFGTAAPVLQEGRRRRPWMFRILLSHSRKGYSEAVWRQSTEDFIACLENAFHHFGGVPCRLVIDNLKAVVADADWYDPQVHPKLQSFAAHYGTVFLPTRPYTPRHKGKIESGVKYAKFNALKGRTFGSLAEQNEFLLGWETKIADNRIHGTTKRHIGQQFEQVERPALLPLPLSRCPFFHEGRRSVHRDGYVEVAKAYYSVPPEYVGRRLWVRWDAHVVRVFNDRWETLIVHARVDAGRFRTAPAHIPQQKVSAVERGTTALLRQLAALGPHCGRWAEATTQARGVEAVRVLVGLKALARKHSAQALDKACEIALAHGAYRLRTIRELVKRQSTQRQQQFEFIEHHPIIRPLSDYSLSSLQEFRKERNHECQSP